MKPQKHITPLFSRLLTVFSITLSSVVLLACKPANSEQESRVANESVRPQLQTDSSSSDTSAQNLQNILPKNDSSVMTDRCNRRPNKGHRHLHLKSHSETEHKRHCSKHVEHRSKPKHIIHISVDGLSAVSVKQYATQLPTFNHLLTDGAFTLNARTDDYNTYTLPNHFAQLTGLYVNGADGHNWLLNTDTAVDLTVHGNRGRYVPSVFDVVHDYGLSTAMFASKSKFRFIRNSWNMEHARIDEIGDDNGTDKIDLYVMDTNTDSLVEQFKTAFLEKEFNYSFIHLRDLDTAGHSFSWSLAADSEYIHALHRVDGLIGKLIEFVESDLKILSNTVFIITSDHAGILGGYSHDLSRDEGILESDIIPFFIYGGGFPTGDLYNIYCGIVFDPEDKHPFATDSRPPIRNGHVANLALDLLGLPMIPDSTLTELTRPYHFLKKDNEPRKPKLVH